MLIRGIANSNNHRNKIKQKHEFLSNLYMFYYDYYLIFSILLNQIILRNSILFLFVYITVF